MRRCGRKARSVIGELGFDILPDQKVGALSRAHQQMVEIAKAFLTEVRLLILDEPTASLTEAETTKPVRAGRQAQERRRRHHLCVAPHPARFQKIGDRITVLRDGRKIATVKSRRRLRKRTRRADDRAQDRRAVPVHRSSAGRKTPRGRGRHACRSLGKECELLCTRRRDHRHRGPCRLRQIGNRARRLSDWSRSPRAPSA